jgi:hypothetical protein
VPTLALDVVVPCYKIPYTVGYLAAKSFAVIVDPMVHAHQHWGIGVHFTAVLARLRDYTSAIE